MLQKYQKKASAGGLSAFTLAFFLLKILSLQINILKMKEKALKWLLYVALSLIVIGIGINLIVKLPSSVSDNAIMRQVLDSTGLKFFFSVVILAPVLEELCFRLWIIDNKIIKYVFLVFMLCFMSLILSSSFIFPVMVILACNLFMTKERPMIRNCVFVIVTSLCFALAHRGNLDLPHYMMAFPVYLGMALLLCWIGLRFGFIYCIVLHILYNFTLITLGGFTFAFGAPKQLEGATFNGELRPVSGFAHKGEFVSANCDTITLSRNLVTEIAKFTLKDSDYKVEMYPESYRFYDFEIKNKGGDSINRGDVLKMLLNEKLIRIDTVKKSKIIRIFEQ